MDCTELFNEKSTPVRISCRKDLVEYCNSKYIEVKDFNEPVELFINRDNYDYGNFSYLFEDCVLFNQPVTIPDRVKNCRGMFLGCGALDTYVHIPDSVTNISDMFNGCISFNKLVDLPDNIKECIGVFHDCRKLNQSIIIPDGVVSAFAMFENCFSLDSKITLPSSLKDMRCIFKNCYNLTVKITISTNKDTEYEEMFSGCEKYSYYVNNIVGKISDEYFDKNEILGLAKLILNNKEDVKLSPYERKVINIALIHMCKSIEDKVI